jgi:WD40 repeat protein
MHAKVDFFISYTSADVAWAEWIAWTLEASGYSVRLQVWDFRPGNNFVADMQGALTQASQTIAVLSPDYVLSDYAGAEWYSTFARDPRGERGLLIPVQVAECEVTGLLGQIVRINLVGLEESEARARLVEGVTGGRGKPTSPPSFPQIRPAFPPLDRSNPYRGLAAFEADDRPNFFGRGRYVEDICAKLAVRRSICVLGASGGGKSSLVRAGVLPALQDAGWRTALCRPRDDPFAGLARGLVPLLEPALSDPGPMWLAAERYAERLRRGSKDLESLLSFVTEDAHSHGLVIAIDQFEEIFTQVAPDDRMAFVQLLADIAGRSATPVKWLLAMRGDFLDQALSLEALHGLLEDATVLLGPMSEAELISAIVEPAARHGIRLEAGLPERLVGDVGAADAAAGRLPLLQFALSELWLRQDGGVIRHGHYDDPLTGIGGIEGALRLHAERVYASYGPEDQTRIRRLFRRLVDRGPGLADLRRLVPRAELAEDWALALDLVRRRLLSVSEARTPAVEVIHEALFRAWPDLKDWIEEHRDFDRWRQELSEQVARWEAAPQSVRRDLLLRGSVLDRAVMQAGERPGDLTPREAAFIQASADARRQEARKRRAAVVSAFVLLLAFASLAGVQWLRAEGERAVALEQTARAEEREAAARAAQQDAETARAEAEREAVRANREADLAVAQRLAVTAAAVLEDNAGETAAAAMIALLSQQRRNTPHANQVLRDALDLTPEEIRIAEVPWSWSETRISDNGRVQAFFREDHVAAFGDDVEPYATLHLLDGATFASVAERRDEGSLQPEFSPDGAWLVAGGPGRRLVVSDAKTGRTALDESYRYSVYPGFGTNGETIHAARTDGVIEVRRAPAWEVTDRLAFPVNGDRGVPLTVAPTMDGTHILIVDRWRAAFAVPTDGEPPVTLAAYDGERGLSANNARVGAVSSTGNVALVQRSGGNAAIWDLSETVLWKEFEEDGYARHAVFDPSGTSVALASHTGAITLRRVADGALAFSWDHGAELNALVFSPDGRFVASAGEDGGVAVWDTRTGAAGARVDHPGEALALAFDPADGTLLAGDDAGTLTRLDPETGTVLATRAFLGRVSAIAAGGAGGRIAVSIQDSAAMSHWDEAIFIDRATGAERTHLVRNTDFQAQALSPDGTKFATWDRRRKALTLWDTETAEEFLTVPDIALGEYEFSHDGGRLLVKIASGPVRVIDAETGERLHDLGEPGGVSDLAAVPDGDIVVTRGNDGTIRTWDLRSGIGGDAVAVTGSATLSEDGSRYAVRSTDGDSIEIHDAGTGETRATLPTSAWVRAFTRSGTRLVTADRIDAPNSGQDPAHELAFWDVDAGQVIRTMRWESPFLFFDTLPGNRVVLRGPIHSKNLFRLEVVDATDGRVLWSEDSELSGSIQVVPVSGVDETILIDTGTERQYRAASDGTVLWRIASGGARTATVVPGAGQIALANAASLNNQDDMVVILDQATGAERRRIPGVGPVRDIRATADGARIVAAVQSDRFHGLRIWDAAGDLLRDIALDAAPWRLILLPDPVQVAVHDFSGNLRVFDVTTGELLHRISHSPAASHAAFARAADRAITRAGASLRLWDTRTGREVAHRIVDGSIRHAAISADGRQVAYFAERPQTTEDGTEFAVVEIWTPETEAAPARVPVEWINSLTFDRTGQRLLIHGRATRSVGQGDDYLRVVDVRTLQTLGQIEPLRGGTFGDVNVNADGTVLLVRETRRYSERGETVSRHSLRAFDLSSFEEVSRVDFDGGNVIVSPDDSEVTLQIDGKWRMYDPRQAAVDVTLGLDAPGEYLATAPGTPRILAWRYWSGARAFDAVSG